MLSPVISLYSHDGEGVRIQIDEFDSSAQEHRLYRSSSSEGNPADTGVLIGDNINPNETFLDNTVETNNWYYYQLKSVFYTPYEVEVSTDGEANYDVVTSSSEASINSANILAEKLGQITGATFNRRDGQSGNRDIWVGTYEELFAINPSLDYSDRLSNDNNRQDEYILESHVNGVRIIGGGNSGVRNGVWHFLRKLGYRYFYPWDTWEHIPDIPTLRVSVNEHKVPNYIFRRAPSNASWTDHDAWDEWRRRQGNSYAFQFTAGHAWGSIISRNQAEFDAHPEWTSGETTTGSKFRISEPGLRALIIQDSINRITNNPNLDTISLDPTDGGGWPTDAQEVNFVPQEEGFEEYDGSHISDRVVYLSSIVAKAINELGLGEKFVGQYAYNEHSPPPNITAHPNVIVAIGTSYTRTNLTNTQLVQAWGEKTSLLGLRDFFGNFVNNQGMLRQGRGGNVNYIKSWFPFCYEQGVRYAVASPTDTWNGHGLGYYLTALVQWDVNADLEEEVEDFLQKAYKEAYQPMKLWHEFLNRGTDIPRSVSDRLYWSYFYLREALDLATDPKVIARIQDNILYVRYCEMHWIGGINETNARNVFKHTYRMTSRMMAPMIQIYRHYRRSDVPVDISGSLRDKFNPGNSYTVGTPLVVPNDPDLQEWYSDELFSDYEIENYVNQALEAHEPDPTNFEFVEFDHNTLVPAKQRLGLPNVTLGLLGRTAEGGLAFGTRGYQRVFTWLEPNQDLHLLAQGGTIYANRGPVAFFLESHIEALEEPVDETEIPEDGSWYDLIMSSPHTNVSGLHRVVWNDGNDRTRIQNPYNFTFTAYVGTTGNAWSFHGDADVYFYVPKGIQNVAGFASHQNNTTIRNKDGVAIQDWRVEEGNSGNFIIPVEEGQDGGLWRLQSTDGLSFRLYSVPPYVARNSDELMLPLEIIEQDEE